MDSLLTLSEFETELITTYPNPANNVLNFKAVSAEILNLQVYDILGKTVLTASIEQNGSLDISTLRRGLYIITFENINSTYKFIKQ
ncbi:T9SS type A sorting domain-containing protein [Psychroserpens sp.]|uniref:T9SS type A sorting domain-containing protein n=1 Tax=Psychroserpens sp. TaxID=2020870 RepID=UPI0039E6BC8B